MPKELELERTALYRALRPMARDGWITTVDAERGNVKTARLTAKGRELLEAAADSWDAVQRRIVEGFGEEQYETFLRELYRLAECAEGPGA